LITTHIIWLFISSFHDDERWYRWFQHHFIASAESTFGSLRLHTLITSSFSHANLLHLLNNLIGVWEYGPKIYELIGNEKEFILFWIITSIVCCLFGLWWSSSMNTFERHWFHGVRGTSGIVTTLRCITALMILKGYPRSAYDIGGFEFEVFR